jgi:hypothetical protein
MHDPSIFYPVARFVAFGLAVAGALFLMRPNRPILSAGLANQLGRGYRLVVRARLRGAFARRREYEDPRIEIVAGLMCCILAILLAVNNGAIIYLAPISALMFVPLLAYRYTHIGAARVKRVAVLESRGAVGVIGYPWFIGFAALSIFPLLVINVPSMRAGAALTIVASLTAVVCAWIVAGTPSVISSVDPIVEQFVDDRLRRFRASALLGCTGFLAAYFVIFDQAGPLFPFGLFLVGPFGQMAASIMLGMQQKPMSATEVTRWSAGAQPE